MSTLNIGRKEDKNKERKEVKNGNKIWENRGRDDGRRRNQKKESEENIIIRLVL